MFFSEEENEKYKQMDAARAAERKALLSTSYGRFWDRIAKWKDAGYISVHLWTKRRRKDGKPGWEYRFPYWIVKILHKSVGSYGAYFLHAFWWFVHNCIAHPMIGFCPIKPFFKFHDYTSDKINLK